MKFKIDENLPSEFAEYLLNAGYDAHTVGTEALTGTPDDHLLERCTAESRILVTLDLDFANIRLYPPHSHPGIVILRPPKQDKQTLLSLLRRFVRVLPSRPCSGQLWVVESDRIRYREQ